jgi:CRISPR/Cas system CSM-associated protein Csm4 (group 5 of RAMP superfamily)
LPVVSRIIDVATIQNIVADLSSNEEDVAQEKFQVNTFSYASTLNYIFTRLLMPFPCQSSILMKETRVLKCTFFPIFLLLT